MRSEDQAARGLTMGPDEAFMAWCRGLKASNRTAFEQVFRALHPPLQRYATHLSGDRATADDHVHDAFVKLWEVREGLDPTRSLKAFLFRTVRNLAYNHRRDHAGRAAKADAVRQALTPSAVAPDERADVQFVENRRSFGAATVELGTRLTYIPDRRSVYAEPRAAWRLDVAHSPIGPYAVRLAGGIYRQFINEFELSSVGPSAAVPYLRFWMPVDRTLAPPRAYHAAADLLLTPRGGWTVALETYYKAQPRLLAVDYATLLNHEPGRVDTVDQAGFVAAGRGYAYGSGLRIEYLDARAQVRAGYSYTQARRRFPSRFEDQLVPVPWNEPHRALLSADVFLSDAVAVRVRARGVWRRSWGFRRAYYDYLAAHTAAESLAPFDVETPTDDRLPPLYQIDAGLTYSRTLGPLAVDVRADILNLLNRRNVVDWSLTPTIESGALTRTERFLPRLTPVFSARLRY